MLKLVVTKTLSSANMECLGGKAASIGGGKYRFQSHGRKLQRLTVHVGHEASSFRAEWSKLALRLAARGEPLACRVPNAAEAWNEARPAGRVGQAEGC